MTTKIIKELSIQVNLNGLSFCILNTSTSAIEYLNSIAFEDKLTPFEALNRLKTELASNTIFADDFDAVKVIHHNELATLVPKSLYDEANNADYLKYNSKILKTDFIAADTLKSKDIVSVYVPYVNINNYLFETFGTFTYAHASTVLIDALNALDTGDHNLFVNIVEDTMQVVIIKDGNIELYNYFDFKTPEDFIYYILFTCEQQDLNPETLQLKLFGDLEKDHPIFEIAYKYIRHVDIATNSANFLIKNSF